MTGNRIYACIIHGFINNYFYKLCDFTENKNNKPDVINIQWGVHMHCS